MLRIVTRQVNIAARRQGIMMMLLASSNIIQKKTGNSL
jgi:hypothetical protein